MTNKDFGALILMAGASSRMGSDKAFLLYSETETFLQHALNVYISCGISQIVLVCNFDNYEKCLIEISKFSTEKIRMAINENPARGRNSSIRLGASMLKCNRGFFLHNIDNPFIEEALVNGLMRELQDAEVCMPMFQSKKGHPLLFKASCLENLRNLEDDIPLKNFLENFRTKFLKCPNPEILLNVNTMQDYEALLTLKKNSKKFK